MPPEARFALEALLAAVGLFVMARGAAILHSGEWKEWGWTKRSTPYSPRWQGANLVILGFYLVATPALWEIRSQLPSFAGVLWAGLVFIWFALVIVASSRTRVR
jgi:hypothetical protein